MEKELIWVFRAEHGKMVYRCYKLVEVHFVQSLESIFNVCKSVLALHQFYTLVSDVRKEGNRLSNCLLLRLALHR